MKTNPPVLGNAPREYDRQYFDMLLGALRSYFDRLSGGSGSAAGATGELQYNDAGEFGASPALTVDTGTGQLSTTVNPSLNSADAGTVVDETNVLFGGGALAAATAGAVNNTAFGQGALNANTTGENNTALGNFALQLNEDGVSNVAIAFALESNVSGSDNVGIGWGALPSADADNNIAIGSNSGGDAVHIVASGESNRIVMGNNSHTNAYIKIAWTVTSDARDKIVHGCVPHGLDFVAGLYPVKYQFRTARGESTVVGRVKYGFLAQEIRALEDVGVVIDDEDPDNLKYNESSLVPILVNAIKELKTRVEALEAQNESGKNPGGA